MTVHKENMATYFHCILCPRRAFFHNHIGIYLPDVLHHLLVEQRIVLLVHKIFLVLPSVSMVHEIFLASSEGRATDIAVGCIRIILDGLQPFFGKAMHKLLNKPLTGHQAIIFSSHTQKHNQRQALAHDVALPTGIAILIQ